jgi:hypothetical protein
MLLEESCSAEKPLEGASQATPLQDSFFDNTASGAAIVNALALKAAFQRILVG